MYIHIVESAVRARCSIFQFPFFHSPFIFCADRLFQLLSIFLRREQRKERHGDKHQPVRRSGSPRMERIIVDDHPLAEVRDLEVLSPQTSPPGAAQNRHRPQHYDGTPSAELIQSAARSILDEATPNSAISKDRSVEGESFANDEAGFSHTFYPALESLLVERVPPIPDEQDRKRFIVSAALQMTFLFSRRQSQTYF